MAAHMMAKEDQVFLKSLPGNDRCIDCGRQGVEWASVSLGIFMCLECSGQHRALGTHISFVRSVKMDSWTDAQIQAMKASGGNNAVREFIATKGNIDTSPLSETPIRAKYDNPAAELWRQIIKARVNGTEEPTELPELESVDDDANSDEESNENKKYNSVTGGTCGSPSVKMPMQGFGSTPHPNEKKMNKKRGSFRRGKRILGAVAAGVGAVAVGIAARRARNKGKYTGFSSDL